MTLFQFMTSGIHWIAIILVTVLGVAALMQKPHRRGRWLAIAALGAAGYSMLSTLASMLGNLTYYI